MPWKRIAVLFGLLSCGVSVMSNGQEKTLEEWEKEKKAAEAEAGALEAQRKAVEARTALAAAEATAHQEAEDKLAVIKAGKEISEANKAASDARKAASEADLAAFKASLGEVPASGYAGDVALQGNAGKVEAALLAARAAGLAASKIAERVGSPATPEEKVGSPATPEEKLGCPATPDEKVGSPATPEEKVGSPATPQTLVVYAAAELPKLDAWTAFSVQTGLACTAFKEAQQLTQSLQGGLEGVAGLNVPVAGAAGLTLEAVNKLLGYFRTDYTIGGIDVTLEDALLVNAVAGDLKAKKWEVRIPARYDPTMTEAAEFVVNTLISLSKFNTRGKEAALGLEKKAADLTEAAAKPGARKADLEGEAKRHRQAAEAWKAASTLYEGLQGKLTQTDDKSGMPLATVVRERSLVKILEGGGKLLIVKLHSSGGAYYTKKNLGTFFGGMPFYHMGGTVASFALLNGKDGLVEAGGVVPVHGGFVKANELQATLGQ